MSVTQFDDAASKVENRFKLERTQHVESLNLEVQEFSHPSGAVHFHLANDYTENVFMVALRTVPHDSTGVAHILEHTALCGSERFPVRDPFFMMIRRSLNTFMNAFTTSDFTAYPFASQNRKDYFNLMEVYLDAVFFSRLDPLDFAQEGHRLEFEVPDDPATPLMYRGVVYNEMKGDSSSAISRLYHGVHEALFPTTTYHYNSGGDPDVIPSLTYEALKDFYRTHYHPANAIFMTFGNISAAENQTVIEAAGLQRLAAKADDITPIAVTREQRYAQPITHELSYAADEEDLSGKTHIVLAWLLGPNTDIDMLLKCHLLSDVLLDTAASPLRMALEKTPLAKGASPLCGFAEEQMETTFMCGVEGSDPEHADAIESLVLEVLQQVADEGIDVTRLEAVLHQLELSQREVGGDGMPFGLQLIFSAMSAAVHRGDPIGLLDIDPAITRLRLEIQAPDFLPSLVKELLLDNPHRVTVAMKPDRELAASQVAAEQTRLQAIKDKLTPADTEQIIDLAAALKDRQAMPEDMELLPKVTTEDVPSARHFPMVQPAGVSAIEAATNGISYFQLVNELPGLDADLLGLLPFYNQTVTEIGSAGRGYLETQHLQHSLTGGISAFSTIRAQPDDPNSYRGFTTLSSRTLNPKVSDMVQLVIETATSPDFDEPERLTDLLRQLLLRRLHGVTSSGHQYAMSGASARLRPVSAINNYLSGVPAIERLGQLVSSLDDPAGINQLCLRFDELKQALVKGQHQALVIAESATLTDFAGKVESALDAMTSLSGGTVSEKGLRLMAADDADTAFVVTSQVNHCAAAYATVAETHEDSAALSVLAAVLRNGFLHTEIREKGGAYGGGATHDNSNGIFRFYSYRDPQLRSTLETFQRSLDWIESAAVSAEMMEEAVLQIISSIDAPGSPAGEIRQAYHNALFDRTAPHREAMRARYLDVTVTDLKRVANEYLCVQPARAVFTSEQLLGEVDNSFEIKRISNS